MRAFNPKNFCLSSPFLLKFAPSHLIDWIDQFNLVQTNEYRHSLSLYSFLRLNQLPPRNRTKNGVLQFFFVKCTLIHSYLLRSFLVVISVVVLLLKFLSTICSIVRNFSKLASSSLVPQDVSTWIGRVRSMVRGPCLCFRVQQRTEVAYATMYEKTYKIWITSFGQSRSNPRFLGAMPSLVFTVGLPPNGHTQQAWCVISKRGNGNTKQVY
jgi:hypothetical protein